MRRLVPLMVVLTVSAAACSSAPQELAGYVRIPAPVAGGLSLPDAAAGGTESFLRAAPGNLLLVYFGFGSCPDVCPATLADIRSALRLLGDDASRVEVAMITVDPGRDTGEVLTAYVRSFIPGARALRTEDETALLAVAEALGASYVVSVSPDGDVDVAHTAHVYLLDDRGELLVTWPFGIDSPEMASDLRILLGR